MRPVAGEIAPGMPTPTVRLHAELALDVADEAGDGGQRAVVIAARRLRPAAAAARVPSSAIAMPFDLGAAQVDADPHGVIISAG